MDKSIADQLEEIVENICDNFCKYSGTGTESGECEYCAQGNECPLNKLV